MKAVFTALASVWFVVVASASLIAGPSPDATPSRISLKAIASVYVQIKDSNLPQGQSVLLARVLSTGDVYNVPDRPGLMMQTGNAGGLEISVDGRVLGPLGKPGEVMTRIPLTPEYLTDRMSASQ